ncbi:hypothetical protein AVEN_107959-1 [Araneus ventricosus]|uniref:Uncharacterized protein n=1 Tax=Araneus ventricosus TaxID=182803 RepID=A0A4Y2QXK4_ARAVE|nr:hypothetical protein AVEN_107959-1 [Araneus ventricosus]
MDREDPAARKRRLARERLARWRARQSQETLNRMRAADNEYHRRRRDGESQEETAKTPCIFLSDYRERIHQQQKVTDTVNQSVYVFEIQVGT